MQHKKKFYFFIFLLALVVLHGTVSWWVGERAERLSVEQVAHLNQQLLTITAEDYPDQHIQLELDTVRRGIWTSQRILTLSWSQGSKIQRYVFQDDLQHGPWPWARLRQQQWQPLLAYSQMRLLKQGAGQKLFEWSQGKEPLRLDTEIDWGGQFNSLWQWAAMTHQQASHQFVLGAGSLDIKGIGQGLYQLKAQAPAFNFATKDEAFRFVAPQWQWITTDPQSIFDGHMYFEALEFEWQAETLLQADQLALELTQHRKGGLFNLSAQGRAHEVVLDGGIELGEFDIRFQLERLAEDLGAQAIGSLSAQQRDELWLKSLAAHPRYTLQELNWRNKGGEARFAGFFELAPRLGDELEKAAVTASIPRSVLKEVISQEKGMKATMLSLLLDGFIKEGQQLDLITFAEDTIKLDLQYDQQADNYVLNGQARKKSEMQAVLFKGLLWLLN